MKNRLPVVAFVCTLLFFASCSKKITYFHFLERNKLEVQEIDLDYLSMKTKINYNDGDHKINASANIRIHRDSIIWFSLTPALGIEAARGVLTKDSMVIIDRLKKEYHVYDYASLSKKYNFDISYELMEAVLLGNPPKDIHDNEKVERKESFVLVQQKSGNVLLNNFIGTKTSKLERLQIIDGLTNNTLNLSYAGFHMLDELHIFPYQTYISLKYNKPGSDEIFTTQIQIDHNKADVEDRKKLKFPFSIPQKYVRK